MKLELEESYCSRENLILELSTLKEHLNSKPAPIESHQFNGPKQ